MSPRLLAIGTRLAEAGLSPGPELCFESSSAHVADELNARAVTKAARRRATVCRVAARCMKSDGNRKGFGRVMCRLDSNAPRRLRNARLVLAYYNHLMGRLLGRIFVFLVVCLISFIAFSIQIFVIWPWYGSTLSVELLMLLGPFK